MTDVGRRVFGAGVMALAVVALVRGDFDLGQPVPAGFPARTVLAYAAGAVMLVAGAGLEWRRTAAWSAAAIAAYYAIVVVILMNGRLVVAHRAQFGSYSNVAEQLVIAASALVIYAGDAKRLVRVGRVVFAICAVLFGIAHFVYLELTAPLVPAWLPPTPELWAYATGLGFIAAGVAIATGVLARLAAILLTAMFAAFTLLVHTPMLVADPSSAVNWSESALNLVAIGAAWVIADSL